MQTARLHHQLHELGDRLDARRRELLADLQRVDAALHELANLPPPSKGDAVVRATPRIHATTLTIPLRPYGDLRSFVAALLAANPQGLLTTELAEAVRSTRLRARKNEIHAIVHALYESGHLTREGRRGSYLYRLREGQGGSSTGR